MGIEEPTAGVAQGISPAPGDASLKSGSTAPPPLLQVRGLCKNYGQRRWHWKEDFTRGVLYNIKLTIEDDSILGLVGESGCGKSTLARCLALLEEPSAGEIDLEGINLLGLTGSKMRNARRQIQLISQDPATALNPRLSAVDLVAEPLDVEPVGTKRDNRRRALELMEEVGLSARWGDRLPLEFSGGQRQRLAIARALALEPRLLILDESLSGLDLSLQAQVVKLLLELKASRPLTYLFISHDLRLVGRIADEVAVMHQGTVVENAGVEELFRSPQHPHTQALLAAAARLEGRRQFLNSELADE